MGGINLDVNVPYYDQFHILTGAYPFNLNWIHTYLQTRCRGGEWTASQYGSLFDDSSIFPQDSIEGRPAYRIGEDVGTFEPPIAPEGGDGCPLQFHADPRRRSAHRRPWHFYTVPTSLYKSPYLSFNFFITIIGITLMLWPYERFLRTFSNIHINILP